MLLEQPHRIVRLDVLRQDEYADVRVLGSDLLRGYKALVGVAWRHANVDDRCVGTRKADVAEEFVSILGFGDDVDACLFEQADDALTREHKVVGDDYAHGITARRLVSPTSSEPPRAPTRSAR